MNRDEQLKQWRTDAKAWILIEGEAFIREAHAGVPANPEITVGQIVAYLDTLAAPPGYELLRPENSLRYQVVRNVIEQAAKDGRFDVGSTTNSRGRESKCFSPGGWTPPKISRRNRRPSFDVEVGDPADSEAAAKLKAWMEENNINLDAVFIQRVAG